MVCQERSIEFFSTVQALRLASTGRPQNEATAPSPRRPSPFGTSVKQMVQDMSNASFQLDSLEKMVKSQGILNISDQFQRLLPPCKATAARLTRNLTIIEEMRHCEGNGGKQMQLHHQNIVRTLEWDAATITKRLKGVLETRQQRMATRTSRFCRFGQEHSSSKFTAPAPPARRSHHFGLPSSGAVGGRAQSQSGDDAARGEMDRREPMDQMAAFDLVPDRTHLRRRVRATQEMESSIQELGSVFTKLTTMITEQGETMQRIDDDIESACANVDTGHNELLKYMNNVQGNRAMILKAFAILLFFVVIVTFFYA